jgi:Leucine-rich repeat (LRR) protein
LNKNLTKLKKLNVSFNPIIEIDSNGFKGLENLEVLKFSRNELSEIEPKCTENMKKLIK